MSLLSLLAPSSLPSFFGDFLLLSAVDAQRMREQGRRFASKGVLVAGGQDNPVVGAKLASKKLGLLLNLLADGVVDLDSQLVREGAELLNLVCIMPDLGPWLLGIALPFSFDVQGHGDEGAVRLTFA